MALDPRQLSPYEDDLATAILGVDTLWGGDVSSASGTGRFIADCYYSDKVYPESYGDPLAGKLRAVGGVTAAEAEREPARSYLKRFDLRAALTRVRRQAESFPALRRSFVLGLADSLEVMLDLALEALGEGPAVSYERCVHASCGEPPARVDPAPLREEVTRLLVRQGEDVGATPETLVAAVDHWRKQRLVTREEILGANDTVIEQLEELTDQHVVPHLPARLRHVPRSNVKLLPIESAWFSGSMNYLGRERTPEGEPLYEATYEINASLEISSPELVGLLAHEVVPGHVMTFALLQHMYHLGRLGFEATILTMNSRAATLHEGLANAAILMAHGVTRIDDLPGDELRLGVLLARLQDLAKSNASYLTYAEGRPTAEVAATLRRDCLVSQERAEKLSGSWARHPLLGRMYLPCYDAGTRKVLALLERHGLAGAVPVLFGAFGLVDIVTIDEALAAVERQRNEQPSGAPGGHEG